MVISPYVVSVVGSRAMYTRLRFAFAGFAYTPYWVTTPTTFLKSCRWSTR